MTGRKPYHISLRWNRSDRLGLLVLCCAWSGWLTALALTRSAALGEPIAVDPERIDSVRERIDPNSATAASLRRLPLIGPERASAIIEYRESFASRGTRPGPAFRDAEDLQDVPDIGPGIVRLARRHLTFSARPSSPRSARPQPQTRP